MLLIGCFPAVLKSGQNHHRIASALAPQRDSQEASVGKPPHHHDHLSLPDLWLGVHPSLEMLVWCFMIMSSW
ncbi:hypothetical protein SORBI_3007G112450 [Sorghum bicolor]|uniref:Uncharacterized protein n=1 Tax=Sorghum bicolor TaxID=4558 RepID=A0A1Z5RA67_SORBI|nr:hypothetical protein SORBI_3007G112450 [Sorghum bicolor]